MSEHRVLTVCFFVFMFFCIVHAPLVLYSAEKAYVTDILYVSLRREPSLSAQRIKLLHSTQQLEVLEHEGEFAHVRMDDGTDGWIQKQYLDSALPKVLLLKKSEQAVQQLKKEIVLLETKLAELEKNQAKPPAPLHESEVVQGYEKQLLALQETNKKLADELAGRKKENIFLMEKKAQEQKDTDAINPARAELYRERQSGRIQWFLAGCFVFFFGWLVGRMSAATRSQRKNLSF